MLTPLERWLREHGISEYRLAQKTGVSRSTINRMRHGGGCNASSLLRLSQMLGMRPEELLPVRRKVTRERSA